MKTWTICLGARLFRLQIGLVLYRSHFARCEMLSVAREAILHAAKCVS